MEEKIEWLRPNVGDKVRYCVCGMARDYKGTGVVIEYLGHVWGGMYKYRVKRGRGTIVVRTPDIEEIIKRVD